MLSLRKRHWQKWKKKKIRIKKILKCLDECPIIVYDGNSVYFSRRKEKMNNPIVLIFIFTL